MFGFNEAMLSFLRRQVGLRTDAASASGSLHGKVTELRNYLVNTIQSYLANTIYPRTDAFNAKNSYIAQERFTYTGSGTRELIDVSGSGYFTGLSAMTTGSIRIRITIDGMTKLDGITNSVDFVSSNFPVNQLPAFLRFKTSLKIEAAFVNTGTVWATYMLD